MIGTGRPAAPGLLSLISLYRTENPTQPPGDVASIRCAALYCAQLSSHQNHGAIVGPSRAQRDDIAMVLRRSEHLRTTEFAANAAQNTQPWQSGAAVKYDMIYLVPVGGRR